MCVWARTRLSRVNSWRDEYGTVFRSTVDYVKSAFLRVSGHSRSHELHLLQFLETTFNVFDNFVHRTVQRDWSIFVIQCNEEI